MKTQPHPLRSTIIFGLICGLLLTPLWLGLAPIVYWPQSLFLLIWFFVVLYSGILARWSPMGMKPIIFPLLLTLLVLPWLNSTLLFLILILGTLSWIRSGVCFPFKQSKRIVIEIFLGVVAGGLLTILNPATLLTWALAVWMFFLVQALYFVFCDSMESPVASIKPDPFEYAREQAENILANQAQV